MQRKYTSGIYLESHSGLNGNSRSASKKHDATVPELKPILNEALVKKEIIRTHKNEAIACNKRTGLNSIQFNSPKHKSLIDCGDRILLRDGKVIACKVYEISEESIKYKLCDQLYGQYYNVKVEDTYKIIFANGTEESFKAKKEDPYALAKVTAPARKGTNLSLFGYFASATLSIIIGAAAAVYGLIAFGFILFGLGIGFHSLSKKNSTSPGHNFLLGFGAFLGVLWVITGILLAISLLAIVVLL